MANKTIRSPYLAAGQEKARRRRKEDNARRLGFNSLAASLRADAQAIRDDDDEPNEYDEIFTGISDIAALIRALADERVTIG